MKKNNFIIAIFSTLIFAGSIYSCKNQDITNADSNENTIESPSPFHLVKSEKGVLSFNNFTDFSLVASYLNEDLNRIKDLPKFEKFTSLSDAFNKMTTIEFASEEQINEYKDIAYWRQEGNEQYLDMVISNPSYSLLFNDKGIVKIGDKIFKHTADKVYIFDATFEGKDIENIPLTQIKTIDVPQPNSLVNERASNCSTVYQYSGGNQNRKVQGSASANWTMSGDPLYVNTTFAADGTFLLKTSNYKRGFLGRWYSNQGFPIGVSVGSVTYSATAPTSTYTKASAPCCAWDTDHFVTDDGVSGTCHTN